MKSHSDDIEGMHKDVMATYHHVTSNDSLSNPSLCPTGPNSWCRQNTAKAKEEPAPRHRYNLPDYVAKALLPIYERLSDKKLLERCVRGKTQNSKDSLHSLIWALAPKERHASLFMIEAAVSEAVMNFNAGRERTSAAILHELSMNLGQRSTKRMREKDQRRSVPSARKRASADDVQQTGKKCHKGGSDQRPVGILRPLNETIRVLHANSLCLVIGHGNPVEGTEYFKCTLRAEIPSLYISPRLRRSVTEFVGSKSKSNERKNGVPYNITMLEGTINLCLIELAHPEEAERAQGLD
ncbi:hypothetical protein HPB49_013153 [Dermacentor silvarum]|uniref:Uncharacterized protein n=1 Tax=Dermacentor silvarum TaxID=543639 RepID=A0ACB8C9K8_DERSI|nr:hypothetical protein HPB49_013153 [Dermacentor silvarum]